MGKNRQHDIEAGLGGGALYPGMIENPQLRWAFVRKIYTIVSLQILLTIVVACIFMFVPAISRFLLARTAASFAVLILIIVAPFLVMLPMIYLRERHPINLILLMLFTICISLTVGLACATRSGDIKQMSTVLMSAHWTTLSMLSVRPASLVLDHLITVRLSRRVRNTEPTRVFENVTTLGIIALLVGLFDWRGKVILEAATLTVVVVTGLTLYTFWAAKRGHDFNFLGPFLFAALLVLMIYSFVQIFFPFGKVGTTIYGCVAAIIFSGFIVYDTDNLIKRHSYDEHVSAAISLYLDIVNLFMALLTAFGAGDS